MDLLIEPDEAGIKTAALLLQAGQLVAFPTETVYGLGANALDAEAVRSIFTAKGRPLTDPLIVHVIDHDAAARLVCLTAVEAGVFRALSDAFWPGPLTIIAAASSLVPALITANTGFVGVRCPKHPLAVRLLSECQLPIAAPSANRFGHVSPTRAEHVLYDLADKGVRVLNGESKLITAEQCAGSCQFGIESTVLKLDCTHSNLAILRHGAVTQQQICRLLHDRGFDLNVVSKPRVVKQSATTQSEQHNDSTAVGQEAPGQAITHYSPDVQCVLVHSYTYSDIDTLIANTSYETLHLTHQELKEAVIVDFGAQLQPLQQHCLSYRDLSCAGDCNEAARVLFDTLRWSESVSGAARILIKAVDAYSSNTSAAAAVVQATSDRGKGNAGTFQCDNELFDLTMGLQDRLFRAASGCVVNLTVER